MMAQHLQLNLKSNYWPQLIQAAPTYSAEELCALIEMGYQSKNATEDIEALTLRFVELITTELTD